MISMGWWAWAAVVLGAYVASSLSIDGLCRVSLSARRIGGDARPTPRLKRWKVVAFFTVNTLQVSTAVFTVCRLYSLGLTHFRPLPTSSGAAWVLVLAQAFIILVLFDTNFYWVHR